jgi:hypothetical protein
MIAAQIIPAIIGQVTHGGAGLPTICIYIGRFRALCKGPVAIVPQHSVDPGCGNVQIGPAIEVEIDSGTIAYIGEVALIVSIEPASGKLALGLPLPGFSQDIGVNCVEVQPAILFEIQPALAPSHHSDSVSRDVPSKGSVLEI